MLRAVDLGSPARSSAALHKMWAEGVRWVVVEKFTSLAPTDLRHAFSAPYNSLITRHDIPGLAGYIARLEAAGRQVHDDPEFTVFRLERPKLRRETRATTSIAPPARGRVKAILRELAHGDAATARQAAPRLYALGVRMVTLSVGALGATPQLSAYGASIRHRDVSIKVTSGRWRTRCLGICEAARDTAEMNSLGIVLHEDRRFTTTVALRPPARRADHPATRRRT